MVIKFIRNQLIVIVSSSFNCVKELRNILNLLISIPLTLTLSSHILAFFTGGQRHQESLKKARWCVVKNERNTSHSQVPATPNNFPTLEPAVSEHGGVLIPNIPIMCDDVVRRNDVGVQTISDWCNTESILSGVDVSTQAESHCVCRCDSHVVHHVCNIDSNIYNDRLEECQHYSYDEEYLLLRDMEVHDNQAGSCTQDDAILSDPDFSYDSQADDTMSFSSIANSLPTGFAVPEVCAITCKQCKVLKEEDNAKLLIKIDVLTLLEQDDEKSNFIPVCPIMVH